MEIPTCTIVICTWREIDGYLVSSILGLKDHPTVHFKVGIKQGDALVGRARSVAATEFLKDPSLGEVLLLIDSDIVFKTEDAVRIVRDCVKVKSVVGGFYPIKDDKRPRPALRLIPNTVIDFRSPPDETIEVIYASTGFMAIHREALAALASTLPLCANGTVDGVMQYVYPFFPSGAYLHKKGTSYVEGWEFLSEDWYCGQQFRDIGLKIYANPYIMLEHRGVKVYNMSDIGKIHAVLKPTTTPRVAPSAKESTIGQPRPVEVLDVYLSDILGETANVLGDVVECGVWLGYTFTVLANRLLAMKSDKKLYGYDSWELLSADQEDFSLLREEAKREGHTTLETNNAAASRQDVLDRLSASGIPTAFTNKHIRLVKGRIPSILEGIDYPVSFVHLNLDTYRSTRDALACLWPTLTIGGIVLIDEYYNLWWPGSARAVNEFFGTIDANAYELLSVGYIESDGARSDKFAVRKKAQ